MAYSFDGVGLGHLRRNLKLLAALGDHVPGVAMLTVTGSSSIESYELPSGVDVLRLPGLTKTSSGVVPARLPLDVQDVQSLRAGLLEAAVRAFRPDLLLVDFYPLGRDGELLPALRALRSANPDARCVLGLRDVLDSPQAVAEQWDASGQFDAATEHYSTVLVYGDRQVYDPVTEYAFPDRLARITHFTGYLTPAVSTPKPDLFPLRPPGLLSPDDLPDPDAPGLVCTVGGGADGRVLAECFLAAVRLLPDPPRALVITGPFMPPADRAAVAVLAADIPGVEVRSFLRDAPAWFARANAVVAMAGYNTATELLGLGTPTVLVPRSTPRLEQTIRAAALANRTGWPVQPLESLSPRGLAEAITVALQLPRAAYPQPPGLPEAGRLLAAELAAARANR